MKRIKAIFTIITVLLLLIPLLFVNNKKDMISDITNAMLPEITGREWLMPSKFDEYINARIGFHDEAIDFYLRSNDMVFGELLHPSYAYGKNGYVFGTYNEEVIDEEFINNFCKYLKQVQDYCSERNVPLIYCINPSKMTVYSRYLPDGYKRSNDKISYLYDKLKENNINYISNIEYFKEKAEKEQIYNVKFDAGHWNDLGAFYGTNHLLGHMKKEFPDIQVHELEDFDTSTRHVDKLPISHFKISETVPVIVNKTNSHVVDMTGSFNSINLNPQHIAFNVHHLGDKQSLNLPRVLFFAGSYYNRNRDFYTSAFRESYSVHNYENFLNFDYYFNIFKPDYVVLVSAEYTINQTYYNPEILRSKELNRPLSYATKHSQFHKITLPENLKYRAEKDNIIKSKDFPNPTYERKNRLAKISFANKDRYKYGYVKKGNIELDLSVSEDEISCTTDVEKMDFDGADIYLFK